MKKLVFILSTVIVFSFTQNTVAQTKDIVEVAVGNKNFSTLVTALTAADLVEALQGDGPFTVFAPTNDSFAKIDAKTLGNLLKPENKKALANILTYHVVSGKYTAKDVVKALKDAGGSLELTMLNGQKLKVMSRKDGIYLQDANNNTSKITATDVMASNGVIHVIENVVMPK
jgi:uncharacterized surface protein with fasciclin (FAS1) repeats